MTTIPTATLEDLKRRAKAGDREALQQLRDSGFFQQQRAARDGYPISHGQRRLWVLSQIAGSAPAYHIPLALLLEGELDIAALAKALDVIVARHESLRTTFATVGAEVRQFVHEHSTFRLQTLDLSAAANPTVQARALAEQHATTPFDLSTGPLLRATLIRLTPQCHVFLFNIHHIVCDAWSLGVLVRELTALYRACTRGLKNPLSPLRIHYKDFTAWQNGLLAGPEAEQRRRYWHAKLAGAPALDLPLDFPRPAVMGFAGGTVCTTLDGGQLRELQCRVQGISPFIVLVALVKVLLYRYTGQGDITVGCPIAGRERPDLEGQIGFFVNTLVLRDRLNGTDRFAAMAARVRETALEAYEYASVPFDQLVEELDLARDLSRSPLFDVMVALETAEAPVLCLDGVQVAAFASDFTTAKFDLTFRFTEQAEGVRLELDYNRQLFRPEKVQAMAAHLGRLLAGLAARPEAAIGAVEMLSKAERRRLLVDFNETAAVGSGDPTIVALIEVQAARQPERIAAEHSRQRLSYGQLNAQANRLAHYLRVLGVGPEVPVGVYLKRSPLMLVSLLGIFKAGGAYLPLDPSYPGERLAFMLSDAQVPVLLSETALRNALPATAARIVCLDAEPLPLSSSANPAVSADPDNLAYVIYTSGSTGRPKGVPIAHKSLMNLVRWHQREFSITAVDRATHLAGVAFDASVWEIWPYLTAGACLCLTDTASLSPPQRLRNWLVEQGITVSFVPTPLAEPLLSLPWPQRPALRCLLTGGDWLHCRPPAGLPFRVINNYGPTENTVVTTSSGVAPQEQDATPPPLGRPIANTRIYILDRHRHPVPLGVPGELCIAGLGLARGYLRRPGLSAERFLPDPFATAPGARLYRTGDLARYRPDGTLDYLGRLDDQIEIRGLRIEPGEIEAALKRCPRVRDGAVAVRPTPDGGDVLVGYLVPAQERLDCSAVRRFLAEILPPPLVPVLYVVLKALPLTAHGKVDRQALPAPPQPTDQEQRAPCTPLERVLAGIYQEVLSLEAVGTEDSFFELGGHSLLAIQVLARVREILRTEVPLPEFFKASRVAELAATVRAREAQLGQAERIAEIMETIKGMSQEDRRQFLEQKRKQEQATPLATHPETGGKL